MFKKTWTLQTLIDCTHLVDDCLEFQGYIEPVNGYGLTFYKGKIIRAHRLIWLLCFGSLPKKPDWVLHTCDNRKCINPNHLYIGTAKQNTADGFARNPKMIQRRQNANEKRRIARLNYERKQQYYQDVITLHQ